MRTVCCGALSFFWPQPPKPSSKGAPKRQRLTILGAWLQAKGEVQGQVETAEAPPPLPKLGMHCVGSSSALFFALMSSISAAPAARAQPLAPAAVPISSGRLAELGSGNPSAGSSAGASNPSPATPTLWEAPAVREAARGAAGRPAAAAEDAEDPKAMQAAHCAALLAAVAAVQVEMRLAQLSKKTVSWFAAGARYRPGGEGAVVWVTRGAVTPRKQVEHDQLIGTPG